MVGAVQWIPQKEAHLAVFHNVRQESKLHESALNLPGVLMRDHAPMSEVHYTMDLPGNIESVYQRLSHDHRKRLRQTEKKLLTAHRDRIRVHKYSTQSDLPRLVAQAERGSTQHIPAGSRCGVSGTTLILDCLQLAAKRNWLRAYVLEVSGKPWAFAIGTVYQATFHLDYIGYDPAFRSTLLGLLY